jgi:transcription antitermination factor NusG
MPILAAEPEMYPVTLWEGDSAAADPGRRWWCLHTKPRQEKSLARDLRKRRIAHYLPQVVQVSRTPCGRKIRSLLPLFPGYMFLRGNDYDRVEARRGNHLARALDVPDQESLERDLRQIHQLLSSGLPVAPEPSYVVGTKVRILAGPLNGIVGTVIRRDGRDRFVALVHFLGRGARITLRDWQAEQVQD